MMRCGREERSLTKRRLYGGDGLSSLWMCLSSGVAFSLGNKAFPAQEMRRRKSGNHTHKLRCAHTSRSD